MAVQLDDRSALELPGPQPDSKQGYAIHWDVEQPGFGLRVTRAGSRSYIVAYFPAGARGERRLTIGEVRKDRKRKDGWSCVAARQKAGEIRFGARHFDADPLADEQATRRKHREEDAQVTVDALCDRFEALHLPGKREATQRDYKSILRLYVRPDLGKLKVRDITHSHIATLHRKVSKIAPTRANRMVAVLSKMFSFAAKTPAADDLDQPMRPDGVNPAKGIDRNQENKRERYLSKVEVDALLKALAGHDDQQAADIVRLLVLTGARKTEVLSATWSQFDLLAGVWIKPAATTKQKKLHRVPLSDAARDLLVALHEKAKQKSKDKGEAFPNDGYVFPGRNRKGGHRIEIKSFWKEVCIVAGMVKAVPGVNAKGEPITIPTPTARVHDLRHTYASLLVSSGLSLPIIGALLGHTQASTTQRYAHLFDDPLRTATQGVADLVMGKSDPEPDPNAEADQALA